MKRNDWLKKKNHAAETIHCDNGDIAVITHDASGRQAQGFGKTEEAAFADAHDKHTAALKRAAHTTSKYAQKRFTGTIAGAL